MREIKFRVFEAKQGRFLEIHDFIYETWQFNGVAGCGNIGVLAYQIRGNGELNSKLLYDNERFKISQYTGLKDKNGKEIYEDDIVKFCDIRYTKFMVGKIRFNAERGRWTIYPNVGQSRDLTAEKASKCEIIGNIYENPELLGGQND